MLLSEIKPVPFLSALQRDWTVAVPGFSVSAVIFLPALVFAWPYLWAFAVFAIAAGIAADQGLALLRHRWRVQAATTLRAPLPDPPRFDVEARSGLWRSLLADRSFTSLVLFSFGTCVILGGHSDDAVGDAKRLLQQNGHPVAGTPSADVMIYALPSGDFVVGGHDPSVLTFVS
jgi:hypothetical protein